MDFTSNKRPENMARITTPELAEAFIEEAVEANAQPDHLKLRLRESYDARRVEDVAENGVGQSLAEDVRHLLETLDLEPGEVVFLGVVSGGEMGEDGGYT